MKIKLGGGRSSQTGRGAVWFFLIEQVIEASLSL